MSNTSIDTFLYPLRIFDCFIPRLLIFSEKENTATFYGHSGLEGDYEISIFPYHFFVDMVGVENILALIEEQFPVEGNALLKAFEELKNQDYIENPATLDMTRFLFNEGEWKMVSEIIMIGNETVAEEIEEEGEDWKRLISKEIEDFDEEEYNNGITLNEIINHSYDELYSTLLKYPSNNKKGVGDLGIVHVFTEYCRKASYYHQILNPVYFSSRFAVSEHYADETGTTLMGPSHLTPIFEYKENEVKRALGLEVESPFEQRIIDTILEDYYQAMIVGNQAGIPNH